MKIQKVGFLKDLISFTSEKDKVFKIGDSSELSNTISLGGAKMPSIMAIVI